MAVFNKVWDVMKDSRDNIINFMRDFGAVEVVLCLDRDKWLDEHPDKYEEDYDDYFYEEVPTVIHFGKYGDGTEYKVISVTFVDGDGPYFKLLCEDDDSHRATFTDHDITLYSMINVYDALEKVFGLK